MRLGLPDDEDDEVDDIVAAVEGVAVTTSYSPLLFGYALTTPSVLLDGREQPVVGWGRSVLPAAPGEHRLQVCVPLFGTRRVGVVDRVVTVTAGRYTELDYRVPRSMSAPGSLAPRPLG